MSASEVSHMAGQNNVRQEFITNMKNETRPVTDKICLLFTLLLATPLFLLCMNYASRGNPEKLLHGVNYNGRYCGIKENNYDLQSYPYVYWPFNPTTNQLAVDTPMCVSHCPTQQDIDDNKVSNLQYPIKSIVRSESNDMTTFSIHRITVPYYPTYLSHNMFCLPLDSELNAQISNAVGTASRQLSFAIGALYNMRLCIPILLSGILLLAILVNRMLLIGLQNIQWLLFSISTLAMSVLGLLLIINSISDITLNSFLAFTKMNDIFGIVIGALCITFAFVFFVRTLTQQQKIRNGIDLIFKTKEVYTDNLSLTFGPILLCVLLIAFCPFWITKAASIISNGSQLPISETMLSHSEQGSAIVYGTRNILTIDTVALIVFTIWSFFGIMFSSIIVEICHYATSVISSLWYWTEANIETEVRDIREPYIFLRTSGILLAKHFASLVLRSLFQVILSTPKLLGDHLSRMAERDGTGSINGLSTIANCYRSHIEWRMDNSTWVEFAKNTSINNIGEASKEAYIKKLSSHRSLCEYFDAATLVCRIAQIFSACIGGMIIWGLVNSDHYVRSTTILVLSPLVISVYMFVMSHYISSVIMTPTSIISDTLLYCMLCESKANYYFSHYPIYAPSYLHSLRSGASLTDQEMLLDLAHHIDKQQFGYMNIPVFDNFTK